jgi:hypothetical protein
MKMPIPAKRKGESGLILTRLGDGLLGFWPSTTLIEKP